ncbi:MAG TPA: lipid II flippase MurJ [Candidatus Saccharibacteria bacterium]|jgi:putative peptidoglycan lipid II flippase|nr:lipid II flippase MurJ [Candidatus Saccharibacteria bacterium]
MTKAPARIAQKISLPGAASLLAVTMLLSQMLGFLRTKLVFANFPKVGPESTDVYFTMFKIPDFFFYILAAGALGVAFIPILTEHMQRSDKRGVWTLSTSLMNFMALLMFGVGIVIIVFARPLTHIVAPNLSPEQLDNAVKILRLIAFNPLFFTVSGVLTSTQQVFGRFFFFAITPLIYNLTLIGSIFLFKDSIGLVGLGIGALAGGLLQLIIAFIGVAGLNFHWKPIISFKSVDFRRVLRQLPARSLDQGVDSLNSIVETNRARLFGDGVVSSYEGAFTIHTAPILLIGSSISNAAFPRLSERLAQGRADLFRKEFVGVLRVIMWLSVPTVIIAYFCRGYLARIIFTKGSPEIALLLGFLSIAIFFRSVYALLSRYFYAHKDTTTPLIISLFAIALNIILVFTLARPTTYGAAGLAIAQSIVSASEVLIIGIVLVMRDPKILTKEFWYFSGRLISVSGFTLFSAFIMLTLLPLNIGDTGFFLLGSKLAAISLVVLTVHVSMSLVFEFEEARATIRKGREIIMKPIRGVL